MKSNSHTEQVQPIPSIISFVIISYNRPKDTQVVVANILNLEEVAGYTKEIIVINNGSTADYRYFTNYLAGLPAGTIKKINYVDHKENLGVARGRNLGITLAQGEYLIFIDDDAEFEQSDVLSIMLSKFKAYEPDNVKILAFRELRTATNQFYIATKNKKRAQLPQFLTNFYVGSGHVIKKEVFDTVGLYTTQFFYGMEEYDLAYKALDAGYKILYTADVTVLHKKSESGRATPTSLVRQEMENKVTVAYTYLPILYVLSHLFFWSGHFLLKTKGNVLQLIKGYYNMIQKIRNTQRKPISATTLQYIKSVQGRLWY